MRPTDLLQSDAVKAVQGSSSAEPAGGDQRKLASRVVAEVMAALAYGERCGAERSERTVALAPDGRTRTQQQHVASRERRNFELIDARFRELGDDSLDRKSVV